MRWCRLVRLRHFHHLSPSAVAASVTRAASSANVASANDATPTGLPSARHHHHHPRRCQQPCRRRTIRPAHLRERGDRYPVRRKPPGLPVRPHPLGARGRRRVHGCSASRGPLRLPGRRPADHSETVTWNVPPLRAPRRHGHLPPAHPRDHLLAAALLAASRTTSLSAFAASDSAGCQPGESRVPCSPYENGVRELRFWAWCLIFQCWTLDVSIRMSVRHH